MPLMRYHFLYFSAALHKLVLQPDTSKHCKTMNTTHRAMCMFTLPAFAVYSSQLTHRRLAHSEMTWVPGSAGRWFNSTKTFTHTGTNQA